ncbi:MAG: DUF4174 domain-containing protein [Pseudomonadota bacterium]
MRVLALLTGALLTGPLASNASPLEALEWKHRVILIDADRLGHDPSAVLLDEQRAIDERHIVWLILIDEQIKSNAQDSLPALSASALRSFYFDSIRDAVILIGKDGGIKQSSPSLETLALYEIIDRMPMRRYERRQQSSP